MAKIATVGGVTGLGFLALSLGLPEMIDGLSNEVSYGLAIVGGILVLTAFVWSLLSRRDDGGSTVSQTTHGPHSPIIGQVRDIHNHYGPPNPAEKHEAKSLLGSGRPPRATEQAAEYIARHLRMAEAYPSGPATFRPDQKPNMNLNAVLVRVYKRLGPPPPNGPQRETFLQRVNREIADKVSLNQFHTWGRMSAGQALREIGFDEWGDGLFDHKSKTLAVPHGLQTVEYQDLHFFVDEIDRIWPKPLETTIDGNP